jgi:hypothetical protein
MAARKRALQKTASGKKKGRDPHFRAIANRLYELRLGARVALDVLVTLDGDMMTFIRIDGALLGELPILGEA